MDLLGGFKKFFFCGVVIVIVILVTGGKQSQLLVFWTWLGLEFDKKMDQLMHRYTHYPIYKRKFSQGRKMGLLDKCQTWGKLEIRQ